MAERGGRGYQGDWRGVGVGREGICRIAGDVYGEAGRLAQQDRQARAGRRQCLYGDLQPESRPVVGPGQDSTRTGVEAPAARPLNHKVRLKPDATGEKRSSRLTADATAVSRSSRPTTWQPAELQETSVFAPVS